MTGSSSAPGIGLSGKPLDSSESGGIPVPEWPAIRMSKLPSLSTQWVGETTVNGETLYACRRWRWLVIWALERQATALESNQTIIRVDV